MKRNETFSVVQQYNWSTTAVQLEYPLKIWFWLWYELQCFSSAMKKNVTFPVVEQYNWSTAIQLEYPEKKRNISCGTNVLMYYIHYYSSQQCIVVLFDDRREGEEQKN